MSSEYKRFRDYELMVVFHPELSEEDVAAEADRVQEYLTGGAANVTHVNRDAPWGRRRLAYPIRHGGRDLRDGIYVLYYFNAETGRIEDMEREIKLNDRIIRYLLTQQIAPIAEPEAPEEGAEEAAEGEAGAEVPAATAEAPAEDEPATEVAEAPADTESATDTAEPDAESTETTEDSESEPAEN
jgi:small subunit ribosomal protein S6